ncbi:hypothetical protein [Micromonospora sp. NBC_00860]|uniref:hypothetical protein n=1 Tax=Micromonospora sp. NBC_00860 TaxID=2975980 RepID=UPI00386DD93C|nr:hypothetical protein OH804_04840 [Micromonospora sp. NBC_00860]
MSKVDQLIDTVSRRIQAYEAGDHAGILDPAIMADAWELLRCGALSPGRYPPKVLHVLAWYRWYRAAVLPPGERETDLQEAVVLFGLLPDADPLVMPAGVRAYLLKRTGGGMDSGAKWLERAANTGDPAALEHAVARLTTELAALPSGPVRALALANLATALRVRFDRGGDEADLEMAVRAGREAVRSCPHDHAGRARRRATPGSA